MGFSFHLLSEDVRSAAAAVPAGAKPRGRLRPSRGTGATRSLPLAGEHGEDPRLAADEPTVAARCYLLPQDRSKAHPDETIYPRCRRQRCSSVGYFRRATDAVFI
ncbi:hypothetical protein [Acidiphilium acidophilum]|jgi:hypothetical protein|uniref:hypothetical protein n=1 Tax=Acidiphilium acidophilum TaxID=76588 RepID=UPI002E8E76E0|nr:hypothetical protein [Acidiphilium acidophilum]